MPHTRDANPAGKSTNSLAALLKSWWSGGDERARPVPGKARAAPSAPSAEAAEIDPLVITQQLWGPGFVLPGGPGHVLDLVKHFGVNPAMSLLDLSAGLGGPSRHVSHTFDVYITGLERSPELAQRGNALSVEQGFGRKVPISAYDPETVKLRPRAFDCAYAQLLTWTVAEKERLIREVARSLKPHGQFTFTDFVLLQGSPDDPLIQRMREIEPLPPLLWRRNQYLQALSQAGLDCRIAQDVTDQFRSNVVEGWAGMVKTTDLRALPKRHLLAVLDQAELWVRRLSAIENGILGVYRFYAVAGATPVH